MASSVFPVWLNSHCFLGLEMLGHIVTLCLAFWEAAKTSPTEAASLHIPSSNAQGSLSLHVLAKMFFIFLLLLKPSQWVWSDTPL